MSEREKRKNKKKVTNPKCVIIFLFEAKTSTVVERNRIRNRQSDVGKFLVRKLYFYLSYHEICAGCDALRKSSHIFDILMILTNERRKLIRVLRPRSRYEAQ